MSRSSSVTRLGYTLLLSVLFSTGGWAQANDFCDGFNDGAWTSRWSVNQGYQAQVGSPVHSGDSALEFHGGCHSSIYRTGLASSYGEYSVWVNQQHHEAGFAIAVQVQPGNGYDPYYSDGYVFRLQAADAQPASGMILERYSTGGGGYLINSGPVEFLKGEWIRVFVKRLPNDTIIAGYERNGAIHSLVGFDPNPSLSSPGAFVLWACSDVPPYTYFDDACFEEYNLSPFCEGFEDGSGWESRWDRVYGAQTLVNSPTNSGSGALQFRGVGEPGFECHSVLRKKNLLASNGRYSFWFNQQHFEAGLWVNFQVQDDPDLSPAFRPGYQLEMHANDAQSPSGFTLRRNDGAEGSEILLTEGAQFSMNEWVKVWVERVENIIIVGYNDNGNVVNHAVVDPSPITAPGGFYISSCSDVTPTDNYYDDICYEPFPLQPPLCMPTVTCTTVVVGSVCSFEGGDVDSSGAVDVIDIVKVVGRAFRNADPIPNPCNRRYEP